MKKLSFQDKIVFNYIVSSVVLTALLCLIILFVFRTHSNRRDKKIVDVNIAYYERGVSMENQQLTFHPDFLNDPVNAATKDKQTNDAYVEIIDNSGRRIFSSSNLGGQHLSGRSNSIIELGEGRIRIKREPIKVNALTAGYFLIGIPYEDTEYLMNILLRVCIVGFFINLALLYFLSRRMAQSSIKSIREIIEISNSITQDHLSARIPLSGRKDEIYELSGTINKLLDHIEHAIEREKSFTSYASHEFRTPLAVLKGTMEVLIRRSRSEEEYKKKITACIQEVDKLNEMVKQLLILTRGEENKLTLNYKEYSINGLLKANLSSYSDLIAEKRLDITFTIPDNLTILTDEYSVSVILKNLLSNAIKYSNEKGNINICAYQEEKAIIIEISNTGPGIPEEDLEKIFEKFYRSYSSIPSNTKGFGLGLPIVKRFCSLLKIEIRLSGGINKITTVKLIVPVLDTLSES